MVLLCSTSTTIVEEVFPRSPQDCFNLQGRCLNLIDQSVEGLQSLCCPFSSSQDGRRAPSGLGSGLWKKQRFGRGSLEHHKAAALPKDSQHSARGHDHIKMPGFWLTRWQIWIVAYLPNQPSRDSLLLRRLFPKG